MRQPKIIYGGSGFYDPQKSENGCFMLIRLLLRLQIREIPI